MTANDDVAEPSTITRRSIPDQIDYLADTIGDDPAKNAGVTLRLRAVAEAIRSGADVVLEREPAEPAPLPSITDGITDYEAEASAVYDLTIDEVREAARSFALQLAVPLHAARIRAGHTGISDVIVTNEVIATADRFVSYLRTGQ